jgi:hypothetical protein
MNKLKLERFIQKYSLGGAVEKAIWTFKNNKLSTTFVTSDKSLLGKVSVDNFIFEDIKLGVYSTNQLQRLLNVVGDNIDISLTKANKSAVSLKISDAAATVNFTLADLAVIETPPKQIEWPIFDTVIDIDIKFIDTFIRGKNALPDANTFTLVDNGNTKIIIGYSMTNSNRVTIPINVKEKFLIDYLSFDANLFKEILLANRECKSALFRVSSKGLAHIAFNIDEYVAEYYLTAAQNID